MQHKLLFSSSYNEEYTLNPVANEWEIKEYPRPNYEIFCAGNKAQYLGGNTYKINDTITELSTYPLLFPTCYGALKPGNNWALYNYISGELLMQLAADVTPVERYFVKSDGQIVDTRNLQTYTWAEYKAIFYNNLEFTYIQESDTTIRLTITRYSDVTDSSKLPSAVFQVIPGRVWTAKPQIDNNYIFVINCQPGEKKVTELINGSEFKFELATLTGAHIFKIIHV